MRAHQIEADGMRVFVSSAFDDLATERDVLTKQVFPRARVRCAELSLPFDVVDLRWGVTEQEIDEGELLDICLTEAEACSVLVCVIGSRCGSMIPSAGPDAIRRRPWLADTAGMSLTELEIRAALDHRPNPPRCLAFVRDVHVSDPRLDALRRHLATHPQCEVTTFVDLIEVSDQAAAQLARIADDLAPSHLSAQDRDLALQQNRIERVADELVGRDEALDDLDRLAHAHQRIVVTGPEGVGKSALLAGWIVRRQAGERVVAHVVDGSRGSDERARALEGIERQIRALLPPPPDRGGAEDRTEHAAGEPAPGDNPSGLRAKQGGSLQSLSLATWQALTSLAEHGPVCLVLDGLQHLTPPDEPDDHRALWWLPDRFPDGVTVVVADRPGRVVHDRVDRGWWRFDLGPLPAAARAAIVALQLGQVGKRLPEPDVAELVEPPVTADLQYLSVVIGELMVHGDHRTIPAAIRALRFDRTADLLAHVLARYEADYDPAGIEMTGDVLSLLWAAHDGLRTEELLDLIGADRAPRDPDRDVVAIHLARLRYAASTLVIEIDGRLRLADTRVRRAVAERYIEGGDASGLHRRIAAFFARQGTSDRALEELPWQLLDLRNVPALRSLLANVEFVQALSRRSRVETMALFTRLAQLDATATPGALLSFVVDDPGRYLEQLVTVLDLLLLDKQYAPALSIIDWQIADAAARGADHDLLDALQHKASRERLRGRRIEALAAYKQAQAIAGRLGNQMQLVYILHGLVMVHRSFGHLDRADELIADERSAAEALQDPRTTGMALMDAGHNARARMVLDPSTTRWLEEAIEAYENAKPHVRVAQDPALLASALLHAAVSRWDLLAHRAKESTEHVMAIAAVAALRDITAAQNIGLQVLDFGFVEQTTDLVQAYRTAVRSMLGTWFREAAICVEAGDLAGADAWLDLTEEGGALVGHPEAVAASHGERGIARLFAERPGDAIPHLRAEQLIWERLGKRDRVATALMLTAAALVHIGSPAAADHVAEAEAIYRELETPDQASRDLYRYGLECHRAGKPIAAVDAFDRSADLAREVPGAEGVKLLAHALVEAGTTRLLPAVADHEGADRCLAEALRLAHDARGTSGEAEVQALIDQRQREGWPTVRIGILPHDPPQQKDPVDRRS